MRGSVLLGLALGCLATACHGSVVLEVPDLAPALPSAVVIIEDDQRIELRALALDAAPFPILAARPSSTITILYFSRPLSALQLIAGPLPLVSPEEPGARPLPIPEQIWASDPDDDSVRSFKEVTLSDRLAKLRISGVEPQRCLEQGGCLALVEGQVLCDQACQPNLPTPPSAPEVPRLHQACPSGASPRTLRDGRLLVCDPPLRLPSCAPGGWQGIWDEACVPDGSSCPAGRFAAALPSGRRLLYVDPLAAPGGDGSSTAPFAQLGAALSAALPDGVVVLAKGRYSAALDLPQSARVDLLGACLAETIIEAPAGAPGQIWRGRGEFRDLTLAGPTHALRVSGAQSSLTLRRVLIEGGSEGGVVVEGGARLVAERLRIRDLRPEVAGNAELLAVITSTLAAQGVILEMGTDGYRRDAREGREGLEVIQGQVDLRDFVIVGGLRGIGATESRVAIEGGLIQEAKKEAHRSSGGRLALRQVVLRDVGIEGLPGDASGFELNSGVMAVIERVSFQRVFNRAVRFEAVEVTLRDVVVEGAPVLYGTRGAGPCRTLVERLHGERPGKYGVYLNAGCEVEADDLWMRGFQHVAEDASAVYAFQAQLVGRRWYLEEGTGSGIVVYPESTVELQDLELRGFRVGLGLFVTGSQLTLSRAKLSEARAVGVCLAPDGRSRIEDLTVERTGLPTAEDGACPAELSAGGAALLVSANLDAQVRRFELRDNRDTGLLVFDGPFVAEDGTIHGNGIGLRSTTRFRLTEQLLRVRLYENQGDLALED